MNYFICEKFSSEFWTSEWKVSQKPWCHLPVASPLTSLASSATSQTRSARCLRHAYRLANKLFDQVHQQLHPLIKQQNENVPIRNSRRYWIFQETNDSKQSILALKSIDLKDMKKIIMRQIFLKLPMLPMSPSIFLKGHTKKDFSMKRFWELKVGQEEVEGGVVWFGLLNCWLIIDCCDKPCPSEQEVSMATF